MAKVKPKKAAPFQTATASTPGGELQKHLQELNLPSVETYRRWCRENGFSANINKDWRARKLEVQHAEKQGEAQTLRQQRQAHFQQLGVEDETAYYAWCKQHNFHATLHKTHQQLRQEVLVASSEQGKAVMDVSRRFQKNPEEALCLACSGRGTQEELRTPALWKIHLLCGELAGNHPVRKSFLQLLLYVQKHAPGLLSSEPTIPALGNQSENCFLHGLMVLATYHRHWRRALEDWRPDTHNAHRQFASLARHLLTLYSVPSFMDAAFFESKADQADPHLEWFLHIGKGQNIRTASVPIALTKMMAHHFALAPKDLTIPQALRWGQVRGIGASERLAKVLVVTKLGSILPDEPFWTSVLFFFVNNEMLDPAQVGPIVDYIYNQRFQEQEIWDEQGELLRVGIPQPNFSMKGRTATALVRQMQEWHRELRKDNQRPLVEWQPSGLESFQTSQKDVGLGTMVHWKIEELLTNKALVQEGRDMHHCVATYAQSCLRGSRSIWSLQMAIGSATWRRVMTIEVDNLRQQVVQARGKCNKTPTSKHASQRLQMAPDIIKRWASQQGIRIVVPDL